MPTACVLRSPRSHSTCKKGVSENRRAMKKIMAMFLIVLAVGVVRGHSQVTGPLKLVQTITLPGPEHGDFNHVQGDQPGLPLSLSAEDNSAIEVIDLPLSKPLQ